MLRMPGAYFEERLSLTRLTSVADEKATGEEVPQ